MRGEPVPPLIRVPPAGVVGRRSTAERLHDDPVVDEALRLANDPDRWPLSPQALADHIGLSRRSLELRLRRGIGRGPGELLREARMREARRLLERTRLPLLTIAVRCGSDEQSNFSRAFKKAFGVSPGQYRDSYSAGGSGGNTLPKENGQPLAGFAATNDGESESA